MNPIIVLLELWFLYEDYYDDNMLLNATYNLAMSDIKHAITEKNSDTVIGMMIADGWTYKHNDKWYTFLAKLENSAKKLGIKKFYLMPGQCHDYQKELDKRNLDFEILEFHWPVQEIKNNYTKENRFNKIQPWNCNTNKFMFLGGAPARIKRIGLLSKLYDAGLLNKNAVWSFYPPWKEDDIEFCRNLLSHYNDTEYDNFIKFATNELDSTYNETHFYIKMSAKELADTNEFNKTWWKNVGYIENKHFQDTSISIVNDGPGDDLRFVTEKVWIPVVNNHPFILADSPARFQYCKDIGLRMFEDYMLIKDYGYIEDSHHQIDAVVKNVKYFLENAHRFEKDIKKDITHNKKVFWKLADQNFKICNNLEKNIGATGLYKYLTNTYLGNYNRIPKLSDIPVHKDEQ